MRLPDDPSRPVGVEAGPVGVEAPGVGSKLRVLADPAARREVVREAASFGVTPDCRGTPLSTPCSTAALHSIERPYLSTPCSSVSLSRSGSSGRTRGGPFRRAG